MISQLNKKISIIQQQKDSQAFEHQNTIDTAIQIMIDELNQCQKILRGGYLLKVIQSIEKLRVENDPSQTLNKATKQVMEVFKACLKQLQLTQKNLESHRGDGRDTEREKQKEPLSNPLSQTQRDELLELKRMAQKELEAQARQNGGQPDKHLTEYIESLN